MTQDAHHRPARRSARGTGRPGWASARWPRWRACRGRCSAALGRALGALLRVAAARAPPRRRTQPRAVFPRTRRRRARGACCASTSPRSASACSNSRAPGGARSQPMRRGLRVEGLEHIEAARADGRGVIVVSGHFTTLEICGRLMCDHVPLAGMYRPHAQPAMEWAVKRGRLRYAAAMFTKRGTAPRGEAPQAGRPAVVRARPGPEPRRQRVRAVLRPAREQPVVDPPARAAVGRGGGRVPARAPRRWRLHAAARRRRSTAFPPRMRPPTPRGSWPAIEAMARAAPDQYLWIHRRFKRQPDGTSPYGDRSRFLRCASSTFAYLRKV